MARILMVGTATLDIVYDLDRYPQENDEVRARGLRVCRGGNAANSVVVLAQLGHVCSFAGMLADVPETAVIEQDFKHYGVDFSCCMRQLGRPPTSSIYLTGASRTIVHFRDLPELAASHFFTIDLTPFDWVHLEGRNVVELLQMLQRVREAHPQLPVSLELEKPREGIEAAFGLASLLICSRGYAGHCGHDNPASFLGWMRQHAPQADIVVAWGESGAYGMDKAGTMSHSPAFPPAQIVDTLGAGDTFNAGLIDAMARGLSQPEALRAACSLAGKKCGIPGFCLWSQGA